jgi:hypothetical protein
MIIVLPQTKNSNYFAWQIIYPLNILPILHLGEMTD